MGVTSKQVVKFIRKGDKGEQGATLRGPQAWSDCATGYAFQAGGAGDEWKDVVLYNNQYYVCKVSHTKTANNYPGSAVGSSNGLWQLGDNIDLVATKILMSTYALVENLGVTAIEMKDADGNVLFQVKDGAVTCKTGTFENVNITGTLNAVTGSFKRLCGINEAGEEVGYMTFDAGNMWLKNTDLQHQGYNSEAGRGHRFYMSDLWCRGQFGAVERNVLVVHGSYGYYYTKGLTGPGTYVAFTTATSSAGDTFYNLPMYGTSGDYAGFPVDTIVFKITSSSVYNYRLYNMNDTHRVLLVNANDDQNNAKVYSNGSLVTISGGSMREAVKLYKFQYPQQDSNVLGAGLYLGAVYDNNW